MMFVFTIKQKRAVGEEARAAIVVLG